MERLTKEQRKAKKLKKKADSLAEMHRLLTKQENKISTLKGILRRQKQVVENYLAHRKRAKNQEPPQLNPSFGPNRAARRAAISKR